MCKDELSMKSRNISSHVYGSLHRSFSFQGVEIEFLPNKNPRFFQTCVPTFWG